MAVKRRPHARGTGLGGSGGLSTGRTLGVEPSQLHEMRRRHLGAGAGLHPPVAPPGCRTLSDDVPASTPFTVSAPFLSSEPGARLEAPWAPGEVGAPRGSASQEQGGVVAPFSGDGEDPHSGAISGPRPPPCLLAGSIPGMPPGSPSHGHPGDRSRAAKRATALTSGNARPWSRWHPTAHW